MQKRWWKEKGGGGSVALWPHQHQDEVERLHPAGMKPPLIMCSWESRVAETHVGGQGVCVAGGGARHLLHERRD